MSKAQRQTKNNNIAKSFAAIPRTAQEANDKGHEKVDFDLHAEMAELTNRMGTHFSTDTAKPGDVAWAGPCQPNGTRVVCYFDQAMEPTDCKNQSCT